HRAGYSPEEDAAHELAAGWMREAGLEVSADEAGTLFGRRGDARAWSGSHLDSVPTAGRFDGALGVVAAIEAADGLRDRALVEVARFVLHVRESAVEGAVATVGAIECEPNATNVVPERVTVSVDARSADAQLLDELIDRIGFDVAWRSEPVAMGDAFASVL